MLISQTTMKIERLTNAKHLWTLCDLLVSQHWTLSERFVISWWTNAERFVNILWCRG